MTQQQLFKRKIIYMGAIIVLLFPIARLGMPSSRGSDGRETGGGWLAQILRDQKIDRANLRALDPTSEVVNLSLLGMKGIAAQYMWTKAQEYKREHDWENMENAVNTIKVLQPRFISVWQFQAWNLAYNVSYERDDYQDRYEIIKRGIRFCEEGAKKNDDDPTLFKECGIIVKDKIGRSDEKKFYRKLFVEDDSYHADYPNRSNPDNRRSRDCWIVANGYFSDAWREWKVNGRKVVGMWKPVFLSTKDLCHMYFGLAMRDEGVFGDAVREEWRRGHEQYLGHREGSVGGEWITKKIDNNVRVRMADREAQVESIWALLADLEQLDPERYAAAQQERLAELPPEAVAALAIPARDRTLDQELLYLEFSEAVAIHPGKFIEGLSGEKKERADEIYKKLVDLQGQVQYIDLLRGVVNFDYWRALAEAEQMPLADRTHALLFAARKAHRESNFEVARDLYEEAFERWRLLFDRFPMLFANPTERDNYPTTIGHTLDDLRDYRRLLESIGETYPISGYALLSDREIRDWEVLVDALRETEPDGNDTMARLVSRLSKEVQEFLTGQTTPEKLSTQQLWELLDNINDLICDPTFSEPPIESPLDAPTGNYIFALDRRIYHRDLLHHTRPDLFPPHGDGFVLEHLVTDPLYKILARERGVQLPEQEPEPVGPPPNEE